MSGANIAQNAINKSRILETKVAGCERFLSITFVNFLLFSFIIGVACIFFIEHLPANVPVDQVLHKLCPQSDLELKTKLLQIVNKQQR